MFTMKGQLMSFDLLVALVIVSICLGIVLTSTATILRNYQIEEVAQINKAQLVADEIVLKCNYTPCGDYPVYWVACGEEHGSMPNCNNKQIGRRFVNCSDTIGELKVITCA